MNKTTVSVILLFSFLCIGYGYENCGSKLGDVVKLTVSGCPDPDVRCILHRSKNATITLVFNLKNEVENVTAVVHGVVLGVPIPFALPHPDACEGAGLECPLQPGGPYTYVATLPVVKTYPKVTVDVKWELRSETGEDIVCVLIPSKIQ